jgi:hypothetical protein
LPPDVVLALTDNELDEGERAALAHRLATSADADEVDELSRLRARLMDMARGVEDLDLVDAVHRSLREQDAVSPRAESIWQRLLHNRWVLASAAGAALAGSLGLAAFPREGSQPMVADAGELRAKGAAQNDLRRWVGIQPYRVEPGDEPERIGAEIRSNAPLLFSYVNLSSPPLGYLMVVAVDSSGRCSWFHPARPNATSDATSLPIARSGTEVPIPEVIRQPLALGEVQFQALFSREPLHARDVAAWLEAHPHQPYPLARESGVVQTLTLRVVP